MAATAFDVEAVRARYSALRGGLAFFDGPGGTQVPDEVIDAIATHFREANANSGGAFATSRATDARKTSGLMSPNTRSRTSSRLSPSESGSRR